MKFDTIILQATRLEVRLLIHLCSAKALKTSDAQTGKILRNVLKRLWKSYNLKNSQMDIYN